ncbi:MAG: sulfatase-like hydrolase/transferase [Candidatus Eremiobacteraeota bacterium]|nr:sulfatase-like hydrolase/transferase [Candidatus Eremiobacteraeota bacterium]
MKNGILWLLTLACLLTVGCETGSNSSPESSGTGSATSQTSTGTGTPSTPRGPNIVLVVLDDVDYFDLGIYGAPTTRTPRLDQLAGQGMRFDQYYSSPKCSDARSSLITGRSPATWGITGVLANYRRSDGSATRGPWRGLPTEITTLAEMLIPRGYATAHFGKWHLGTSRPEFLPSGQGFQESRLWSTGPVVDRPSGDGFYWGYNYVIDGVRTTAPRLGQPGADEAYLPRRLTDDAIDFITRHRDQPFYVNLWHFTPHAPYHVPAGFDNTSFGYNLNGNAGKISAMVTDVDREVGRLVDAIDALGLGENTLILVVSDNGGLPDGGGGRDAARQAKLIRAYKGTVFEGGVRVPCIARWTGHIPAGRLNSSVASSRDLVPTIAQLAGASLPSGVTGQNLVPVVTQDTTLSQDQFFIYQAYMTYADAKAAGADLDHLDQFALRSGNFKLIRGPSSNKTFLYDLGAGPGGEFADLSGANPAVVADLMTRFTAWQTHIADIPFSETVINGVRTIPFTTQLDFADGNFTFAADVESNAANQLGVIAHKAGSWTLFWINGRINLKLWDDRPDKPFADREVNLVGPLVTTGVKHRVGFSVYALPEDNQLVSLSVDGVAVARLIPDQYPAGQTLFAVNRSDEPITLGARGDGTQMFDGTIANLHLSALALPPDEL